MSLPISSIVKELRPLSLAEQAYFEKLTENADTLSCEYSFANLVIWGEIYQPRWCEFNNSTFIHLQHSDDLLFPLGNEPVPEELMQISEIFRANGSNGAWYQTPPGYLQRHPNLSSTFRISENRNYADYFHKTERLVELSGRKLSKKRNLIRQFQRRFPNAKVQALGKKHEELCLSLSGKWSENRRGSAIEFEQQAISNAFRHFNKLKLCGTGIFDGDRIFAFSICSRMGNTAVIHFEKAEPGIKGAAQFVNQTTAEHARQHCSWINREQDLGITGLRKAKMSYDPDIILQNFDLVPMT